MGVRSAWKALWGADVKARSSGPFRYNGGLPLWLDGRGASPVPPGARLDYVREAGRLDLNGVVAVCLGWLADNAPTAQIQVGTRDDEGEYQPDDAHPLVQLFRRPNPYYSFREILAGTIADYKIDGNAYWLKVRGRGGSGSPTELWWLPNSRVRVIASGTSGGHPIDRYEFNAGTELKQYPPEDVVHFRDLLDPENPLVGLGRLKRQLRAVAGLNAGDTLTASALRNAHTGILLVPREPLAEIVEGTPEEAHLHSEARAIRRGLGGEGYGGVRAANLPLEPIKIGMTPEELKVDVVLDRPEAMVTAAMGLNALVLNLPGSASTRTYSNLAEARKQAWEDGIVPMQDAIADVLQTQLLYVAVPGRDEPVGEWGDAPGLECWWDRSGVTGLQEDEEGKAQRVTLIWNAGLYKDINEARSALGLTPLTDAEMAKMEADKEAEMQRQQDAFAAAGGPAPDDEEPTSDAA